jgi:hypothetical protein
MQCQIYNIIKFNNFDIVNRKEVSKGIEERELENIQKKSYCFQ